MHKNQFFESDSEVFDYKENKLLFTTDTFSNEDLFRDNNPYQLGRNLAVATLSDILASGGAPLFYGHSMVVSKQWQRPFIIEFSRGIADVIKLVDATFLGGDFGQSEKWQYTGIAIGEVVKPLSRIGAKNGDSVYLTGKAGAGNLEAALTLYSDLPLLGNLLKNYTVSSPFLGQCN